MTTSSQDLETLWSRLAAAGTGQRRFVSIRIEDAGTLDVHAAMRGADRSPCLLFDIPDPSGVGDVDFEVGGMRCARAATDTGQSLALSLEDAAKRDLFATLCADIIGYAASVPSKPALSSVLTRLNAWRLFLRSLGAGMGRNEIVGLIGELQVLRQLLEQNDRSLPAWRAPDDGIHDFENVGHALEVKATLGPGSRVTISGLDQLDRAGLERLDLIHVRLYEFSQGDSVDDLVCSISEMLPDDDARRQFSNALLRRGLNPDDRRGRSSLRALTQQITAYRVDDGFPRIVRAGVPPGIADVTYSLNLGQLGSAVEPWPAVRTSFSARSL